MKLEFSDHLEIRSSSVMNQSLKFIFLQYQAMFVL